MNTSTINLSSTLDFLIKSPNLFWETLKWGVLYFAFTMYIVVLYIAFFFLVFGTISFSEGSEVNLNQEFTIWVAAIGLFVLIMLPALLIQLYILGTSTLNLKHLANPGTSIPYTFSEIEATYSYSQILVEGLKRLGVELVYLSPLIVVYFVFYGLGMIGLISEDSTYSMIGVILSIMGFIMYFAGFFLYHFWVKPAVLTTYARGGASAAINLSSVVAELQKYPGDCVKLGLYLFVPYILWFALYFINSMLVYVCIGIFTLPFVIGLYALIKIYAEPHILAQAINKSE